MIVLDASAAVDALCFSGERGDWLTERLAAESSVHVPAFFDLEVLQSLRGLEAGRVLADQAVDWALVDLDQLRTITHGHAELRPRIWALRHNLTAYDAVYIALAEALDAPLLTTDARLGRSSGHDARIELPPV